MPISIQVQCSCGRTLRALPDQAGTPIQCWSCKTELLVPHPNQTARLIRAMADAATDAFRWLTLRFILTGAVLITAALLVPRAGPVLALALIAAAAGAYGAQVRAPVLTLARREAATALPLRVVVSVSAPAPDQDDTFEEPPRWAGPARGLLAVAAALVFAAPILIRNRGQALPSEGAIPGVLWLLALALAGWLLMPVVLVAAHACDSHGPLPPRLVLRSLARHPLAALTALLIVPTGLVATEALVATLAWEQGQLPLMVADLFPPPIFVWEVNARHLSFHYDDATIDVKFSGTGRSIVPLYPRGLRRGFSLVGTIPLSLSVGLLEVRTVPLTYEVEPATYLITRIILTVLILSLAGLLFTIQARWLGLIAAVDPRRPADPAPVASF